VPNWRELKHAYGSAEDIPEIISALTPDPKSPAWDKLWSRVCHQGTTYSASPAILPFLLSIASKWNTTDRAMPLALAGSIVAAPQTILHGYEETVEGLRTVALDTVNNSGLSREERVYVMQSVLAFQGDRLWGRVLDRLIDGEFLGLCRGCRKNLYLVIGKHGMFVTSADWVRELSVVKVEVKPLDADSLGGVGKWLYTVFMQGNDLELADWVRYLFGSSNCPECGKLFALPDAIAEIETNNS
jgi:hypothetical protein